MKKYGVEIAIVLVIVGVIVAIAVPGCVEANAPEYTGDKPFSLGALVRIKASGEIGSLARYGARKGWTRDHDKKVVVTVSRHENNIGGFAKDESKYIQEYFYPWELELVDEKEGKTK